MPHWIKRPGRALALVTLLTALVPLLPSIAPLGPRKRIPKEFTVKLLEENKIEFTFPKKGVMLSKLLQAAEIYVGLRFIQSASRPIEDRILNIPARIIVIARSDGRLFIQTILFAFDMTSHEVTAFSHSTNPVILIEPESSMKGLRQVWWRSCPSYLR